MKIMNIKNLTFAILCSLSITIACSDDFLNVGATGSLSEAQMTSFSGIDGVLIGAYASLNGTFGNRFEAPSHWVTGSVAGGEANKGTDPGDYSSINPVQRYETDATQGDLNQLWRGRFDGVSRANSVLKLIAMSETLSAADAARLSGEARLLRGHFYFDLKKHFNNVPYIDETIESSDISDVPNSPGVTWDTIIADFQYAFDNIPATQAQAGRVNKWAALAYLGKAKLYKKDFAGAKSAFDQVIASGVTPSGEKYALLDNYANIYNAEYDNHAEAVMDVEAANNSGSVRNANYFDDLNYPYNTGADGPGNCCGFFQPSFSLANAFRTVNGLPRVNGEEYTSAGELVTDYGVESSDAFTQDSGPLDPRIDHSIGRRGIPYLDWIAHPGKAWIRAQPYAGPYSPKKYIYYKSQEGSLTDASSWTRGYALMNYTIIRFADVLLMAAEAEIEAGSLDKALDYVNQVRRRAANSAHWVKNPDGSNAANYDIALYSSFPSKDFATKALRMERKLELSGEGHRFFDLVRWGIAADELNKYLPYETSKGLVTKFGGARFTAGKNEYYPIPQTQIDIQGSDVLSQNPGY
ncbi:MAG: RagB/SusD family nutrient uptake outer membrane protein [Bacteroidetes bacterium]|nr:RagB/SusD family nutrient uptake outer membrane protein [Bacteroidota bacterium]MDA0922787.1 RagB/SusD family nutrient uptake outer membrane protein [Bacteroidota bacterium]MDA1289025.1 RagB/SusD family nutrient uptake outer membrane protein [Bacteroidota bacterium]